MKNFILAGLDLYRRLLRPLLPAACRFYPSCSDFARQAVEEHGAWRGIFITLPRLARCHPFHCGGFDPVPRNG